MTDDDLRLLTVRQPHAWAIVNGGKDVENRSWKPSRKPPFLFAVHAGCNVDQKGLRVPVEHPPLGSLARGAVIGFARLVYVHRREDCGMTCSPWASPDYQWHWDLGERWALDEPIPAGGAMWLHRPDDEVRDQLLAKLRQTGRTAL